MKLQMGDKMVRAQSKDYIIDRKTGFYNRRFFNFRLREEQRRTKRSGSPFSVLKLDTSRLAELIEKRPKLKIHQMKKVITNIIRENTRDIDIKSWHDDTTLTILMPQTAEPGAMVLAEKLQEMVNEALTTFFGLRRVFDLKRNVVIKSYPEGTEIARESSQSELSIAKKSMVNPPIRWKTKKVKGPEG
jgi:diguanylate cyclase (GGDEF)-like protein